MISPYVRRLRFATELRKLRQENEWTAHQLATLLNVKRQRISRLENAHHADIDLVMRILRLAHVDGQRWETLVTIARQGGERGWWDRHSEAMGRRQALFAELEAGATRIAEYQMTMLPGLLQLPAYTQARIDADRHRLPPSFDPEYALEARGKRQQMLIRPGGPRYEVVLDELAIRRPVVPATVAAAQLDHLIEFGHTYPQITIRVLRLTAKVKDFAVPRSAFSAYWYPDPGDPVVVAVDTVTSDLILTAPSDVCDYLDLYRRLADAALSPIESLDFLAHLSNELHER